MVVTFTLSANLFNSFFCYANFHSHLVDNVQINVSIWSSRTQIFVSLSQLCFKASPTLFLCVFGRFLDQDLVVRDKDGNILDPDLTSTVNLFRAHEAASKQIEARIQEEKVNDIRLFSSVMALFFFLPAIHLD